MFGVPSYEAQQSAATIHKTSKMTHIFHNDEKLRNLFQNVYVHHLFTWVPFSILVNARFEVLTAVP